MIDTDRNLSIKKLSEVYLQQDFKLGVETYGVEEATSLESLELFAKMSFGEKGYYFGVLEFN